MSGGPTPFMALVAERDALAARVETLENALRRARDFIANESSLVDSPRLVDELVTDIDIALEARP